MTQSSAEIERFVHQWADEHVHDLTEPPNMVLEVDRLAAQLTSDARKRGITGGDIHRAVGSIDAYLTQCYRLRKSLNPGAGQ